MAANSDAASGNLYNDTAQSTLTDNFSFATWVYLNATGSSMEFFMNGVGGGFGQGWEFRYSGSAGKFQIDVSYVTGLSGSTTPSSGTWYHIVITRSSTSWKLYVNGSDDGVSDTSDPYSLDSSAKTVVFGVNDSGTSTTQEANGRLAYLGYWERVLTGTEISNLASCSTVPADLTTNLVISLPLTDSGSFGTNGGSGANFSTSGTLYIADNPSSCAVASSVKTLAALGVG